jgi:hypothetical protein
LVGGVQAQTDLNAVISDALRHGAHLVKCVKNRCQDQTTMEVLQPSGPTPDGVYLVYSNTPDAADDIDRARTAAKAIPYQPPGDSK